MARISAETLRRVLIAFGAFNFLSALVGMIGLTLFDGMGMPPELAGPFTSFVVPGLILGIVVGGTQLWSAAALIRRTGDAPFATAVAGLGMQLWIVIEVGLINEFVWLHALYFGTGTAQLVLLLGALGVAPRLAAGMWAPRSAPGRGHASG